MDVAVHTAEVSHNLAPGHSGHVPSQAQSSQYFPLAEVMAMLEKVLLRGTSDQSQELAVIISLTIDGFLPCERGVDSGSEQSECDAAAHGSDACPDVPDVMEDSDVRTVSWLMQTGEEEVHSEKEDDSLDRRSDVAQSDSLSAAASSQDSQQIPSEDVDHAAVDGAEGPPQCSEGIVPDTDVIPPEAVRPDETPLDTDAADIAPPDSNPPDIDSPGTNSH
ncbi:unnamed protein product [Boreogadus saida]